MSTNAAARSDKRPSNWPPGRVLVVEDDAVLNSLLVEHLERAGHAAHGVTCWREATEYLEASEPSLMIMDVRLPDGDGLELLPQLTERLPVIVLTAYGSVRNAVRAIKAGAADYLTKPINLDEFEVVVERALETAALRRESAFWKQQVQSRQPDSMVGSSVELQNVRELIDAVGPTDMTALILGESGVGKELVARSIHRRSLCSRGNFIAVDCCTIQQSLFESELFGHERGAFTSADRQKKGLIEGAEGGTLFLDEISEIEPPVQAKLLRVLETGQYRRVGGTLDRHASARIVAASNRDVEQMVREGTFRQDLYYRLNGFTITIPPLRERRADIPKLIEHFLENYALSERIRKRLSSAAMKRLVGYDWPGNVRELKNVVERAIILSRGQAQITPEHLLLTSGKMGGRAKTVLEFDQEPTLSAIEAEYATQLLTKYGGHRATVASIMGISERSLYRLLRRLDERPSTP